MSAIAPRPTAALPSPEAVIGQAGQENFTVASALLGRRSRHHLMAIYGFARLVDDVGDEAAGDRTALLDLINAELERIYRGEQPEHELMRTLADTVRACELPAAPFGHLIEANRRDQLVTRYETFEQLLAYCQLSAAPVGELVLHVFGAATEERIALSDQICAGLQITEHLQDVAEDYERGRIYLPREDMVRFGCSDNDLLAALPTAALTALISFEAGRARSLLSRGAPLARTLRPRPRIAVAGFVAGGRAALHALERRTAYALERPSATRRSFAVAFAKAAVGR